MDRVFRPFRLQPPLVVPKLNRLLLRAYRHDQPSGCRTHSAGFRSTSLGLRLSPAGSPRRQAESSSCSSGLVIHLPMLPTSRCREAVSFGYRTRFRPDGDSNPAGSIHLQTNWRTPPGVRMRVTVQPRGSASLEACATGGQDAAGRHPPGQACGGHGWKMLHAWPRHPASPRLAGLRRLSKARRQGGWAIVKAAPRASPRRRSAEATVARRCDRPPGWSHLGCDHAGPSLRGPWMALAFAPAHPSGPASASARLAWRASHRRSRHTSAVPPTCQGCRGHGWPGSREARSRTTCPRRPGSGCRTRTRTAGRIRRDTRSRCGTASRCDHPARPSPPARTRCLPSRAPAATCR